MPVKISNSLLKLVLVFQRQLIEQPEMHRYALIHIRETVKTLKHDPITLVHSIWSALTQSWWRSVEKHYFSLMDPSTHSL